MGCSPGVKGVAIQGAVSFGGKPVEKGTISLVPEDGRTAAAVAEIRDGRYAMTVLPGPKRVQISSRQKTGSREAMVAGQLRTVDVTQETIPEQYNAKSTLRIDVSSGSNKDFDFSL